MRVLNIVLHIIKMVLRVTTYSIGVIILMGYFAKELDFIPRNINELVGCFSDVPFTTFMGMYFSHLFNFCALPVEMLGFCSFTLLPFILRATFTDFGNALSHELETGDYTLVNTRTGAVVGGGFDGSGVIIVILSRLFVAILFISLSFIIVPIMFVVDIIKLIRFFFD